MAYGWIYSILHSWQWQRWKKKLKSRQNFMAIKKDVILMYSINEGS